MMGALVVVLLVLVAVYPPADGTVASRARFASAFQTDAGGFGFPAEMIGVSLDGHPITAASLADDIAEMGYDFDRIGAGNAGVPRLFLARLPSDLETLSEKEARNGVFLKAVLPLVLYANEEILADRERLWRIRYRLRRGLEPAPLDRLWLMIKADQYRVDPADVEELSRRLDIVPPSVALAQAAIQSGWGTSALVRQRNALFGRPLRMTVESESVNSGALVVGKINEASSYDTLLDSVRAYIRHLNVDPAYEPFRRSRAAMRTAGASVDGVVLAAHLKSGSGPDDAGDRVDTVRAIIEAEGLRRLDDARLLDAARAAKPSA
jgi:Bax protein